MCGRYQLAIDLDPVAEAHQATMDGHFSPRYNIAPTQNVPVLRHWAGRRALEFLRWGLIPRHRNDDKGSPLINARSETIVEKPSFRESFFRRRCIVPATGFYEWLADGGVKTPHLVRAVNGPWFGMAGLWDRWRGEIGWVESFTVVTCPAHGKMKSLHDRMPVILSLDEQALWLDPATSLTTLQGLMLGRTANALTLEIVSDRVNSVRNDDIGCQRPAPIHAGEFQQQSLF